MEQITDEFVEMRMAQPLETILKQDREFYDEQKRLSLLLEQWNAELASPEEWWEQFNEVEDAMAKHSYLYGKAAYKLGCQDGIRMGKQYMTDRHRTVLTLEDMAHLIYIYDAVKKMNVVMLGGLVSHHRNSGVCGALERVFDVIESGSSPCFALMGEDKGYEMLAGILDDETLSPEERAVRLVGRQ